MEVNFNSLRVQIGDIYSQLCDNLNDSIKDKRHDPRLVLSPDLIQKNMEELRSRIWVLCCCYQENDPDVKDVSAEVECMPHFNPE